MAILAVNTAAALRTGGGLLTQYLAILLNRNTERSWSIVTQYVTSADVTGVIIKETCIAVCGRGQPLTDKLEPKWKCAVVIPLAVIRRAINRSVVKYSPRLIMC